MHDIEEHTVTQFTSPPASDRRAGPTSARFACLALAVAALVLSSAGQAQAAPAQQRPVGHLDSAISQQTLSDPQLRLRGWAADPDTPSSPVEIDYYVGGPYGSRTIATYGTAQATLNRPDVGRAYPALGSAHGFDIAIYAAGNGTLPVYVYTVDTTTRTGTLLGVATLVEQAPIGHLDTARSTAPGQLSLAGWAIDQNTPGIPVRIDIYLGGPYGHAYKGVSIPANTPRPDVAKVYPSAGPNHGFTLTTSALPGTRPVCVYAINTNNTAEPTLLGCPVVTVT
jgi:hypothetical protein